MFIFITKIHLPLKSVSDIVNLITQYSDHTGFPNHISDEILMINSWKWKSNMFSLIKKNTATGCTDSLRALKGRQCTYAAFRTHLFFINDNISLDLAIFTPNYQHYDELLHVMPEIKC